MNEPHAAAPAPTPSSLRLPTLPSAPAGATTIGTSFVSNYPPFGDWSESALDGVRERIAHPPVPGTPLGLYVHVPFCRKRCRFCYFKVYTERNAAEVSAYVAAVVAEMALHARTSVIGGRTPRFVYIGGGTPSYLSSSEIGALTEGLQRALPWDAAEEVAFECEPGTISESKLSVLRAAGVTRLSLGVESFDDEVLEENGRSHHAREVYKAYEAARRVGLPQINIDLIVGMLGETDANWDEGIRRTIELSPDSVTIYQMEVPPNTGIARELRGDGLGSLALPTWEEKRARQARAYAALEDAGYRVSSAYTLVRKDRDVHFRYRDNLWAGADLVPVGVSSFGHLGGVHLQNEKEIERYVVEVEAGRLPLMRGYVLGDEERFVRELILQLKLGAITTAYFIRKFGQDPRVRYAELLAALAERGLVTVEEDVAGASPRDGRIRLSREALLSVDSLLPAFYPR
jgi:oxygen-independent coproporphyrinogen-3 oxidase